MDEALSRSMAAYYHERAGEYDEIYVQGKSPLSTAGSEVYRREVEELAALVRRFCRGRVLDVPCGTGFWLEQYLDGCDSALLVDQAEGMLGEARKRLQQTGKCAFRQADALEAEWGRGCFDAALVGFFLSHLTDGQIAAFLSGIKAALAPAGCCLLLDSVWSPARAAQRDKEGRQSRQLNDGRRFEIYKRYFTPEDLQTAGQRAGLEVELLFAGEVYLAGIGRA